MTHYDLTRAVARRFLSHGIIMTRVSRAGGSARARAIRMSDVKTHDMNTTRHTTQNMCDTRHARPPGASTDTFSLRRHHDDTRHARLARALNHEAADHVVRDDGLELGGAARRLLSSC